jgi:hypothetical protein
MNGAAILLGILALFLLIINVQGTGVREANAVAPGGAYQLRAQIPAVVRKGEVVRLILYVQKGGLPVDKLTCCLTALPLFPSVEDTMNARVSGGIDLGTDPGYSSRPGCPNSIAGTMIGPGTYEFTLEPEAAGRVNMTFTVGANVLTVPVDVASAAPNPAILAAFVILIVVIMGTAAFLRRRLHPGSARL